MKVLIAGAGLIGTNLAQFLSRENHQVYLIESCEATAQKANEKIDGKVIVGNAADPNILRQAGVHEADLVIAVTARDEVNLVVCSLASCYHAGRRIARVRNASLAEALKEFGYRRFSIDEIINPEELAAQTILQTLHTPGAREVADFANGRLLLRAFEIPEDSPLCYHKLLDLAVEDFPWPFLIVAIIREGDVIIPSGEDALQPKDRIYVLLPAGSLGEFLSFINPQTVMPNKVVIYGAREMGRRVAQSLIGNVSDVTLVEENEEMAEDVAEALDRVRVIRGAATESEILKECGIEAADVFLATTDNDHSNLVSAVLAKKLGAKTTLITTQLPDYNAIVNALDIDAIINPRLLAVDQILRLVRGRGIHSVTKLMECDTEALEFVSEPDSPITRAPIKEISFPKKSIVGAVIGTDNSVHLAKGDTVIQPGDRVIVFCHASAVKKLQGLFTKKGFLS